MKHVFISYVREDSLIVDKLRSALFDALSKYGISIWVDREQIRPGSRWQDSIRSAIRSGDFFVACFSSNYLSKASNYMNEELTIAIEELRKRQPASTWFIPALLTPNSLPDRSIGGGETLHDIQYADLHEDWTLGVQSIVSAISPMRTVVLNMIGDLKHRGTPYDSQVSDLGDNSILSDKEAREVVSGFDFYSKLEHERIESVGNSIVDLGAVAIPYLKAATASGNSKTKTLLDKLEAKEMVAELAALVRDQLVPLGYEEKQRIQTTISNYNFSLGDCYFELSFHSGPSFLFMVYAHPPGTAKKSPPAEWEWHRNADRTFWEEFSPYESLLPHRDRFAEAIIQSLSTFLVPKDSIVANDQNFPPDEA